MSKKKTIAETVRENDTWYHANQKRIAEAAGLTVKEFRNKAESVRFHIASDPEKYRREMAPSETET